MAHEGDDRLQIIAGVIDDAGDPTAGGVGSDVVGNTKWSIGLIVKSHHHHPESDRHADNQNGGRQQNAEKPFDVVGRPVGENSAIGFLATGTNNLPEYDRSPDGGAGRERGDEPDDEPRQIGQHGVWRKGE